NWFGRKDEQVLPERLPGSRGSLGLHREFEQVAQTYCQRYGIDEGKLKIHAVSLGFNEPREIYGLLLACREGDPEMSLRLAFMAPGIHRKILAMMEAQWLGDFANFVGVWTQWPPGAQVPGEILDLLRARWGMSAPQPQTAAG